MNNNIINRVRSRFYNSPLVINNIVKPENNINASGIFWNYFLVASMGWLALGVMCDNLGLNIIYSNIVIFGFIFGSALIFYYVIQRNRMKLKMLQLQDKVSGVSQ